MTLETVRSMLAWCTVINLAGLVYWFVVFALARGFMYRLHTRWFQLTEADYATVHYRGMATYKIGILLFNLVPYLALRIVG